MCFAQYDSEPDETIFLHLILHNPYFLSYILYLEINLNICLLSFSQASRESSSSTMEVDSTLEHLSSRKVDESVNCERELERAAEMETMIISECCAR